jgi:pimeloyl-ACP methyl ester carboxylesterase
VKKFLVLTVVTLLLVGVVDAFAGDVEKALSQDLSECGRIVRRIADSSRSGAPTATDVALLKRNAEAIQADRLLLTERHGALAERSATLGGTASDRQQAVSSTLLKQLDDLLSRLDAIGVNVTPSDLEALKQLLDTLAPHKSRPLLGALPYKHTNYPPREPAATPVVKPAYKGGDRSVFAADTATTPEAPISKEIVDLAQSLQWNPVLIYEWVKNNVETEWYWGSMKGAEETLRQKSGNDADQAALLVALLRSANFPARYIKGTIEFFPDLDKARNLTGLDDPAKIATFLQKAGIPFKPVIAGGKIDNFRIEHIWVETYLSYSNSRGAIDDGMGKTWLGLDTSIKPPGYTRTNGIGLPTDLIASFRDDYLASLQQLTPLDYIKQKAGDYLTTNQPGKQWNDLLDQQAIIPNILKIIPSTLQFPQIAITGEYQTLPDELKHKVAFTATTGGNDLFTITLDAHKLSNRRIALKAEPETVEDQNTIDSFGGLDNTPPYLVRLRPVLTIDGERMIVAQDGLPMGGDYTLNIDVITPNGTERITSSQINGNLSVIGVVAQLSTKSTNDTKIVESDDAETILHKEAISYIGRWNKDEDDLAALLGQRVSRPTVSIATVGAQLEVTQLLDTPHDVQWKGLFLDAGYRRIESVGRNGNERDFMRLSALQGSILENRIFEDDLKVDSVSTAKLLQLAATGGTTSVSMDKTTIDTILPTLALDDTVKSDITNAVNQGLTVTIPQTEVTYQNWTGIGYIKEDPTTGESGWMLSGRVAGGMTAVAKSNWIQQDLADLLTSPYTARPNMDITQASRALRIGDYQSGTAGKALSTPLMIQVVDNANRPIKGIPVTFRVIVGGASLQGVNASGNTITQPGTSVTVTTTSNGIARARLTLGQSTADAPLYITGTPNSIQIGQNLVSFSVDTGQGFIQGDKPFESFGFPGDSTQVLKVAESSTDKLYGNTGTFSGTLWVQVADEYGNPVSNKTVTFSPGVISYLGMTPGPDSGEKPAKLIASANSCSGIPTLSCVAATDSITTVTGYNGATAGIILGNVENTEYTIDVKSTRDQNGVATSTPISTTFTHRTVAIPRNGVAMITPYLDANYLLHFDDRGNRIDVGAAGSVFGPKLITELIYYEEKHTVAIRHNCTSNCYYLKGTGIINPTKVINGRVDFTPQMGGGSVNPSSVTNTDSSIYNTTLTLGAAPSLNVVNVKGAYQADIPGINKATGIEYTTPTNLDAATSISIWGIGLSLDTSSPVFIDKNGYPEADTYFPFQINPRAYTTRNVDMRFFENQNYLGFVTVNPSGQLVLSQGGAKFDLTKTYSADVVLNWGSGIEVRSITVPLDITTMALIPDYDHNRKIDDKDRQRALNRDKYYFWANDDDGKGDTEGTGIPGSGNRAEHHETVDGTRDLIDWFPVNLDLNNMFNTFDPASYTYTLKHEDGSLDFVITGLSPNASGDYLTTSLAQTFANAVTIPITSSGYVLSQALIDTIKAGNGTIIVESWKQTQKPLVLEVSKGGALVKSTRLNLSIDGVEQMFRHKNLIQAINANNAPPMETGAIGEHHSKGGEKDRLSGGDFVNQGHFSGFDATCDDKYVVLLHGANVDGQDARGWHAELFKRLYWAGSRARFLGVSWYSNEGKSWEFYPKVVHAFDTAAVLGPALKLAVGNTSPVTIIAHSLGNMVVSSYLADYYALQPPVDRPNIANYLLLNAAVALEAFLGDYTNYAGGNLNETFDDSTTSNQMVHSDWFGYQKRFGASEWHQLFDVSDGRSRLTWRNRFTTLPGEINYINFYSTGEDVLASYAGTQPSLSALRRFKWVEHIAC